MRIAVDEHDRRLRIYTPMNSPLIECSWTFELIWCVRACGGVPDLCGVPHDLGEPSATWAEDTEVGVRDDVGIVTFLVRLGLDIVLRCHTACVQSSDCRCVHYGNLVVITLVQDRTHADLPCAQSCTRFVRPSRHCDPFFIWYWVSASTSLRVMIDKKIHQ